MDGRRPAPVATLSYAHLGNALLKLASMSPRIANTIDVVRSDMQLAMKSLCLFMV